MSKILRTTIAAIALTAGSLGLLGVAAAPASAATTAPCWYGSSAGLSANVLSCYGARDKISNSEGKTYNLGGHRYEVFSASATNTSGWLDGRYMICSAVWSGECKFV